MLFVFISLFFRVNPPRKRAQFIQKGKEQRYNELIQNRKDWSRSNTISSRKIKEGGEEDDYEGYVFEDLNFTGTNADTNGKYTIHNDDSNLLIQNCHFTNCYVTESVVYFNSPQYDISINSSIFTDCYNNESPVSHTTNIIFSAAHKSIVEKNTITFADIEHSCRAFHFQYSRNTILRENIVTNANVGGNEQNDDSENKYASGMLFIESGTGDPLEITGCRFTSCSGGNGAISRINSIDYPIVITGTTFEKIKHTKIYNQNPNKGNENEGAGYLMIIDCQESTLPVLTFKDCKFSYLESNSKGGGAIGLWFMRKINKNMSIIFDGVTFEHLAYRSDNSAVSITAGGALIFSSLNTNKDTHLIVRNCNFENITGDRNGAAINYEAPEEQLIIEGTTFKNVYTKSTNARTQSSGGAIYIKTTTSTYPISIVDCVFENTYAKTSGNAIQLDESSDSPSFLIQNCTFTNCMHGSFGSQYVIVSTINDLSVVDSKIIFDDNSNSACAGIKASKFINCKITNVDFSQCDKSYALYLDQGNQGQSGLCHIEGCIFDTVNNWFNIILVTHDFVFTDNQMRNRVYDENSDYFGKISFASNIENVQIVRATFSENLCDRLYGGGIGLMITKANKVSFIDSIFTQNEVEENPNEYRPSPESDYYNGDGGAIQIGYSKDTSENDVLFENCTFENNKAPRHGGAIAIQTLKVVDIINCKFITNCADYKYSYRNAKYENHFNKKTDGRGGAIYINPCFSYTENGNKYPATDLFMTQITIQDCRFDQNKAYDGFAIYIEGDESVQTKFIIKGNTFTKNYYQNANSYSSKGGVIASEIGNIYDGKVSSENTFDNDPKVSNIIYVDHFGETPSYNSIYASSFKGWDQSSNNHLYRASSTVGAKLTYKFTGIGFTLFGVYKSDYGKLKIYINDEIFAEIDESQGDEIEAEIFKSPELEFKIHTLEIEVVSGKVEICKADIQTYYSSKFVENFDQNSFGTENNNQDGFRYSSNAKDEILEATITCTQFYILGDPSASGTMTIKVDNKNLVTNYKPVGETDFTFNELIYTSSTLEQRSHTIMIVSESANVVIDSIVYTDHEIYLTESHSNFEYSEEWTEDANKGHKTTVPESSFEYLYFGSAFKLFGTRGASCSSIEITVDGQTSTISLTETKYTMTHVLLVDSTEHWGLQTGQHIIKVKMINPNNVNNAYIEVSQIIYMQLETPPSPSQSLTPAPSETIIPEVSSSEPEPQTSEPEPPVSSEQPPVQESSEQPPVQESSEQPPVQESSEQPPVQESSEQPPVQESSEQPPVQESSEQPPVQESSEQPPVQESSEQPPVQESSEQPPVQESSEQPPVQESSEQPPVQESSEQPPVQESSEQPPVQESSEQPPVQESSEQPPVQESSEQPPVQESSEQPPVQESSEQPPVQESSEQPPVQESSEQPPVQESSEQPPVQESSEQPPVQESSEQPPVQESSEQPPVQESSEQPPVQESSSEVEEESSSLPEEPTSRPPQDIITDDSCDNTNYRCEFEGDIAQTDHVIVKRTEFKDFTKYLGNGGAIYLVDCGLTCDQSSTFTNCEAKRGGGAIFIKTKSEQPNNITITGCKFSQCTAIFGGCIYVYTKIKNIPVRITGCEFICEQLLPQVDGNPSELVGGNAIFMTARNGRVASCQFSSEAEIDGALKFFSNYEVDAPLNKELQEGENVVLVSDCTFDSKKNAKNSIVYVRGNYGVPFEVKDCSFSGRLSKGTHYIKEEVMNKESPEIRVKSCKFADPLVNKNKVNFLSVEVQNPFSPEKVEHKIKGNANSRTRDIAISLAVPAFVAIAIVSVLFVIIKKKSNNLNDQFESSEESDDSTNL